FLCVLLVLLLFCTSLFALSPDKAITQFIQDVWGKDEGLPQLSVRNLVQTPDGYLWIATDNGLARFDGFRFAVFGPQNENAFRSGWISQLCKDRDGSLWIGTRGADLIRYQNSRFTSYAKQFDLDGSVESIVSDRNGT